MYNVQGTRYKVQGTGYRVQGYRVQVQGTMYNVQCTMYKVQWYNLQGTRDKEEGTMNNGKRNNGASGRSCQWPQLAVAAVGQRALIGPLRSGALASGPQLASGH